MATQSLYRRYRPRTFAEVKGQDHVVKALRDAVADSRSGQAYLFSGPRGTGKTTTARILAKALNCTNVTGGEPCAECDSCKAIERGTSYDVHELDAASNNGVEAVRDLIEKASLGTPGHHKVYILDECHMLSKPAEAALLKTLEEPPAHVVFVLATTDPQKMSDTIRSRTQHLQFHLLPTDTLAEHVKWVATDAGLERDHNEDYAECWTFSQATGPQTGLFIVADGLGGQDAGEVASKMATLATWEVLRERIWQRVIGGETPDQDEVRQALLDAVGEANRTVYEARLQARNDMSTTITLALVVDEHAYIANVGDSRTYLFNSEGLRTITKDHSLVQRMVDTGQIQPSQVYSHPQRNLVYNTIGDRAEVNVDVFAHDLEPEDRLLLCSDGLWEMVRDEGIEEALMAESDPQRACDRLVRHANLAGGEDNISVIIVQALGRDGAPQAARPASGG